MSDRGAVVYPPATDSSLTLQNVDPYFQSVPEANPITLAPHTESRIAGGQIEICRKDLQSDGEALHMFLLSQSASAPQILLHCRGTHTVRTTGVVAGANENTVFVGVRTSVQTHVDFDFFVHVGVFDAASHLPEGTARASAAQIGQFKGDRRARIYRGFPPQEILEEQGGGALKSSKSLRHANPSNGKQFVYEKVAHGWDLERLREAVLETIHANESFPENEKITVTFRVPITNLYIKSGKATSTAQGVTNSCSSCLCLPVSGPSFFSVTTSATESVLAADAVASYAIANGEPSHATVAEESDYPGREWVREWQPTITHCVRNNLSSRTPVPVGLPQNS
ncbi:hypothetical protein C8J57DRAFT_1520935 [Mycena rebaudengoi]|nr:hypothetical protein C8J57DRAFT_1520935 [Mycena rebaudengoi]